MLSCRTPGRSAISMMPIACGALSFRHQPARDDCRRVSLRYFSAQVGTVIRSGGRNATRTRANAGSSRTAAPCAPIVVAAIGGLGCFAGVAGTQFGQPLIDHATDVGVERQRRGEGEQVL